MVASCVSMHERGNACAYNWDSSSRVFVIPADAGIQQWWECLGTGFRRCDGACGQRLSPVRREWRPVRREFRHPGESRDPAV